MSTIGWIGTVAAKADYELSCFITCNRSQSVLFSGSITSLQYLIKQYARRPTELQSALHTALDGIMSSAFKGDKVDLDVQVRVPDSTKPAELSIQFSCTITVDGMTYTVGKLVQVIDSRILAIRTLNQG